MKYKNRAEKATSHHEHIQEIQLIALAHTRKNYSKIMFAQEA